MKIWDLADILTLNGMDTATIRERLRSVLTGHLGGISAQEAIRELAEPNPALFFEIGVSVLESLRESPARAKAYVRLLECQEFLRELIRPGRYSDKELKRLCASWVKIDGLLDLRLARLIPGRDEDSAGFPPELVARVLEVLHQISVMQLAGFSLVGDGWCPTASSSCTDGDQNGTERTCSPCSTSFNNERLSR